MKITARELSEAAGMDYVTANGLLRFMVGRGEANISEKRKTASGRGKPTNVYEVPDQFVLDFTAFLPDFDASLKATENALADRGLELDDNDNIVEKDENNAASG